VLSGGEPLVLLFLGRAHAARGEVGLAVQAVSRAADAAPGSVALRDELFRLYLAAGNPEAAGRTARELRELSPGSAHAVYLEGLAKLAGGHFPQARALLQEALDAGLPTAREAAEARCALAQGHAAQGQVAEARALLEEVVASGAGGDASLLDQARVLLAAL